MGDKKGDWSENLEWDEVQLLKLQIDEINENMAKRAWGHSDAKKEMGGGFIRTVFKTKEKAVGVPCSPQSSPTSVAVEHMFDPPALAI